MIKLFDRKEMISADDFAQQAAEIFGNEQVEEGLQKLKRLVEATTVTDLPPELHESPAVARLEELFAQLEDLVEELAEVHGQQPVIFSVSFGVGLVMEWLKRARREGRQIELRGLVLISPVACVEDLLAPGEAKPTTLLGRAINQRLRGDAFLTTIYLALIASGLLLLVDS